MSKIFLHPLAIMNIADHQARKVSEEKNFNPQNPPRVLGAVFGTQKDQTIEILSSIELPFKYDEEKQIRIDDDMFGEDTELYKQIYPDHECLGWYATGSRIHDTDMPFHKRFCEYNESPLYIRMDPLPTKNAKTLPITIYRSELKIVKNGENELRFASLPFKVVSELSERVTTDHIIQNREGAATGSQIAPEFDTLKNALGSLRQRVQLLVDYLTAIETGKVQPNQNILQGINSVCNRLPTMVHEKFKQDLQSELANGMMMTYLASMTKTAEQVDKVVDLYEQVNEQGARGRMRGFRRFMA